MDRVLGTCSICGGRVTVPHIWGGVIPPTPTCESCGAQRAGHGPVIPMTPPAQVVPFNYPDGTATDNPIKWTIITSTSGE